MTWSINQVKAVFHPILALIIKTYSLCLNCNATLTFKIHIVQPLPLGHLDGMGILQQTVGKGTFSVVNMCYDTEVSYVLQS